VIDAFSRTVCLGEGMDACGHLSDEAMTRAVEALKVCARKMKRRGVTRSRVIATEACRAAVNSKVFIDRVRSETGLSLDIIPPAEEARLAAIGCWPLVDRGCRTALVFDIGGGSTEMIWLDLGEPNTGARPKIAAWTSLPFGVVTLTERFGEADKAEAAYRAMVDAVKGHIESFRGADALRPHFGSDQAHLLGTSGTVTTLAGLFLGLPKYQRDKVDGAWMKIGDVLDLCHKLSGMSLAERATVPCIGMDRATLVVAGCAILEAINDTWPAPRLRVADRGLREGMLMSLMIAADREDRRARRGTSGT